MGNEVVRADVEKALLAVGDRHAGDSTISIEILFPVNHHSIKPTLKQRLMIMLSMDAYANGSEPGMGRAEVQVHRYVNKRLQTIEQFHLE